MEEDEDIQMRDLLLRTMQKSPKQFSNIINHNDELVRLRQWIVKRTSKLDASRTLTERIYWIVNGIKEFPRCQNPKCGRLLDNQKSFRGITLGYKRFCSKKCSNSDPQQRALGKATRLEKNGGKYFSEESLEKTRQSFIKHYGVDNNMKSPEGLKEYQDAIERRYGEGIRNQWQRPEVIAGARAYRKAVHGSETWNNPQKTKATKKAKYGSENYYNRKKAAETSLRNHGVDHPMKDPEIAAKSFRNRHKTSIAYEVDGIGFDSLPEVCFYLYYRDHGIPLECHPADKVIKYQDQRGAWHVYHPDFYLPHLGYLVELKGNNHFRDKDPTKEMISLKGPEYDHVEQAKQRCMKEHGVILLASADYDFYLRYAKSIYGRSGLLAFKKSKKKMWRRSNVKTSIENAGISSCH